MSRQLWVDSAWGLCAAAGGFAAGLTIRSQRAGLLRDALPIFGGTVLVGFVLLVVTALVFGISPAVQAVELPSIFKDIVLYFAVTFVLEEVAFRGGLDSHVYPYGESGGWLQAWGSALFVSTLWALWHLPPEMVAGGQTFTESLIINLIYSGLIGLPLSFCWRRSGTLVLPALAHALIDSYRNALLT